MPPLNLELKEETDLLDICTTSVPLLEETNSLCIYKNEFDSTPLYVNGSILSPKIF